MLIFDQLSHILNASRTTMNTEARTLTHEHRKHLLANGVRNRYYLTM